LGDIIEEVKKEYGGKKLYNCQNTTPGPGVVVSMIHFAHT
jgi:hypothetical protein